MNKTKVFLLGTILSFGLVFQSCEKESTAPAGLSQKKHTTPFQKSSQNGYQLVAQNVLNGLQGISTILENNNSDFSNQEDVLSAAETYYSNNGEVLQAFINGLNNYGNQDPPSSIIVNDIVNDVENELVLSTSSEGFINYLNHKYNEVLESTINSQDKETLLYYLSIFKVSVEFLSNNHNTIQPVFNKAGWWNSWGRCAAAIVGGATLGALTGAGAGSVIPGLGTAAGGVIGGIGGGLSGAAAGC